MPPNGARKRVRIPRVQLTLAPGATARVLGQLKRGSVLGRLALAFVALCAIWISTRPWLPPFEYHLGYTPARDVVARVDFSKPNPLLSETDLPTYRQYKAGDPLASAGKPLKVETLELLRYEYLAYTEKLPLTRQVERGLAVFGMMLVLAVVCGFGLYHREPRLLARWHRFAVMLLMLTLAVAASVWASQDPWRAELVPLLVAAMTFGIAYGRELAMVLAFSMALVTAIAVGQSLGEFLMLMGVVSAAVLQLGRVRSRRKLIGVGFFAGLIALPLTLGVGLLMDQPLGWPLLSDALRNAMWTLLAGFLITGLLPFIEGLCGVVTEISLLELADVAHPLLQELVRRAPGTYNHSINVASLAEAAAEAIGARGLLVRVGAYFHDIGKMLKPAYFVENQAGENSRHDHLVPAMSTLIIIAHVKDGADLARQHRLPEPIVDFIEQHHGTTLVEYFYRRASEQSEQDGEAAVVPESSFRYPGPKPQTVEAAVLMLADAVESAARTLVEPGSSCIESLVHELAMKRLLDGQFDECGLTLKQLATIEDSLSKSLIAMYHARVKYPEQRTA